MRINQHGNVITCLSISRPLAQSDDLPLKISESFTVLEARRIVELSIAAT